MQKYFFCVMIFIMGCKLYYPADPIVYDDQDKCGLACDNLKKLGCDGWRGSPGVDEAFGTVDDISCEDVCRGVMTEKTATLYPTCTMKASSCEQIEQCFQGGQ